MGLTRAYDLSVATATKRSPLCAGAQTLQATERGLGIFWGTNHDCSSLRRSLLRSPSTFAQSLCRADLSPRALQHLPWRSRSHAHPRLTYRGASYTKWSRLNQIPSPCLKRGFLFGWTFIHSGEGIGNSDSRLLWVWIDWIMVIELWFRTASALRAFESALDHFLIQKWLVSRLKTYK